MEVAKKTEGDLEHYGVKGMKWGVRRGKYGQNLRGLRANRRDARAAKKQQKWEDTLKSKKLMKKVVVSGTTQFVNHALPGINKKYKRQNMKDKRVMDAYKEEIRQAFEEALQGNLGLSVRGTSPNGQSSHSLSMDSRGVITISINGTAVNTTENS